MLIRFVLRRYRVSEPHLERRVCKMSICSPSYKLLIVVDEAERFGSVCLVSHVCIYVCTEICFITSFHLVYYI